MSEVDPRPALKCSLFVNPNELFMVSQLLKKDIKPLSDPRCLVDISKAQERDYYYDYISGAHEGRFDIINKSPFPLSNQRYVAGPSFKKYSQRLPIFMESARYPVDFRIEDGLRSPDPVAKECDHNRATGKHRNLSQGVPDIAKMTERKFHAPPKPFKIPESYDPWRIKNGTDMESKFKKT